MLAKLPVIILGILIIEWVSLVIRDKATLISVILAMLIGVILKILWDQQK